MAVSVEYLVNGAVPAIVGGTGTAAKYFADLPGRPGWATSVQGVNAAADSLQQGVVPSATSAVGQLRVPGANSFNGQVLQIIAAGSFGFVAPDPSGTVNIELVANTGTEASPVYVVIASLGAAAPNLNTTSWMINATLFGDSASGLVSGYYTAMSGGAFKNQAGTAAVVVLQNNLTGINFNSGGPTQSYPYGLLVRATFGTSDASNTASLYQFQICQD